MIWNKINPKSDSFVEPRYGHTAKNFKGGMIIFGGASKYNDMIKMRCCMNDLRLYKPGIYIYIYIYTYMYIEIKEWKYLKTTGDVIESRRNHACEILGRSLIIHGGLNDHGRYLNDLWELNLSKKILFNFSLF